MGAPRPTEHHHNYDFLQPRLDSFIDMKHELVLLASRIDWARLERLAASKFPSKRGRKALPARFTFGLLILKSIYDLSDDDVVRTWVQSPYYQYFTGEEFFQHKCPHERSNLSHVRKRMGEELDTILTESLRLALDTGALDPSTLPEITVDTTVMEKNVTYPTDAKLMAKAASEITKLCKAQGVKQRRTYKAEIKHAHMMANRYAHGKQRKRMKRELRLIYSRLGRLIREAQRNVDANPSLHPDMANILHRAKQVRRECDPRRKTNVGRTIFSWHAPEVECIGKGKAHKPFEFGVKASVVTPNQASPGGMFVLDCEALHGKPHDGHTLKRAIERVQAKTSAEMKRVFVDRGYRGHKLTGKYEFRVHHDGQKTLDKALKAKVKRRAAIEPVIGHLKNDGCMGRNYLKGKHGDKINAIMAAVGYNFRQILNWLRMLWAWFWCAVQGILMPRSGQNINC